eukprot:SAG31_NODE_2949_length_4871_cov_2.742456_1_plen_101_part_00
MLISDIMGDPAAVSSMLARLTASGAFSEFLVTPFFGRCVATANRQRDVVARVAVDVVLPQADGHTWTEAVPYRSSAYNSKCQRYAAASGTIHYSLLTIDY